MAKRFNVRVTACVLTSVLCVAGCGSGTEAPGDSVFTPDVVTAALHSDGGGFHGTPPSGAPCDPAQWTYVITVANHEVTWTGCTVGAINDATTYAPASTDHVLDASTWSAVRAALAAVTISGGTGCGADKDSWTFTLEKAGGSRTYGDDFYACQKQYAAYVTTDSLDNLSTTLSSLP